MKDRDGWLVSGAILILLGIGWALGAVSLGTYSFVIVAARTTGFYLVYSWFDTPMALVFSGFGVYSFYRAAKSSVSVGMRPGPIELKEDVRASETKQE